MTLAEYAVTAIVIAVLILVLRTVFGPTPGDDNA